MSNLAVEIATINQDKMEKHDFVTIADLSKERILYLLGMAQEFENHPNRELLKGKVVATLFFEPSTRTQLSFQTAANRLGCPCHRFFRCEDLKHDQRRNAQGYHPHGEQLCRCHCHASLHRGFSPICKRSGPSAHRQRRRRSAHAPFTMYAGPLLHLQDPRNLGKPEHLFGWRSKIRTHRPLPHYGHAPFPPHLPFHSSRGACHAHRV